MGSWLAPPGVTPRIRQNVTALDGTGAGVGTINNENSGVILVIVQLSVITSPIQTTTACSCRVQPPTGIMDTSYFAGTGDVAGDEPYFLYSSDFLTLTWSGGPINGQGIASYQYYEVPG